MCHWGIFGLSKGSAEELSKLQSPLQSWGERKGGVRRLQRQLKMGWQETNSTIIFKLNSVYLLQEVLPDILRFRGSALCCHGLQCLNSQSTYLLKVPECLYRNGLMHFNLVSKGHLEL